MRLVIFVILAAILLVTIFCDASSTASSSSSKKDKGTQNKQKHHKKRTSTTPKPLNPFLVMTSTEFPHQSPALAVSNVKADNGFADLSEFPHLAPSTKKAPKPDKMKNSSQSSSKDNPRRQSDRRKNRGKKMRDWTSRNKRRHKELLELLAQGDGVTESQTLECCPSVVEMVEPLGGINMAGHHVELYRQGDVGQRFYERSCEAAYLKANKPCRFVDSKLKKVSRCVQQYSYSYALVRDSFSETNYRLDYIKIRSGCACEIAPPLIGPEVHQRISNSTLR